MAQPSVNVTANIQPETRQLEKGTADAVARGIQGGLTRGFNNLGVKGTQDAFRGLTSEVRSFDQQLDRTNRRVIAFGASASIIYGTVRAFKELVSSTIEVEKTLTSINSIFRVSARELDSFGKDLFNVARQTGQSFRDVAKAAEEFSRQGFDAAETAKRTRDAMILVRLSGVDATKAVNGLTAAMATFGKTGIDTTAIINKLVTVDQQFAVSAGGLIDAFTKVGSTLEDAGVSLETFIGLVTAARQITGRSEAVIGNSLKTIFTRLERSSTIEQLEGFGIAVRDASGSAKDALGVFNALAQSYDKLTRAQQQQVAELGAGVFQINQFKALVQDLGKANGVAAQATRTASRETNDALVRNESLNRTLAASINTLKASAQQAAAVVGELTINPTLKGAVSVGTFIGDMFAKDRDNAGNEVESFGSYMGERFLKGLGNLLLGPGSIVISKAILGTMYRVAKEAKADFGSAVGAVNTGISGRLGLGGGPEATNLTTVNSLLDQATTKEKQRVAAATTLAEREAAVLAILERQLAVQAKLAGGAGTSAGVRGGASFVGRARVPGAAGGYLPIGEEAAAIAAGVGGAPPTARPVFLPGFPRGGGQRGIVANTSEYIVPKAAGGLPAIYNRDMVRKLGLPPGATPVAAGGYIPNAADGSLRSAAEIALGSGPNAPTTAYQAAIRRAFAAEQELEKIWTGLTQRFASTIRQAASTLNANAVIAGFGPIIQQGPPAPSERYLNIQNAPIYQGSFGGGSAANAAAQQVISPGRDLSRTPGYYTRNRIDLASGIYDRDTGKLSAAEEARIARDIRIDNQRFRVKQELAAAQAAQQRAARLDRNANRVQLGALAGSFGAAFLPEGESGQLSGQLYGGASSALQGSAIGAGLGSLAGPKGILAGAGIGAFVGAVQGFISRSKKSFEELAGEVEEANRLAGQQLQNAVSVFQLDEQEANLRANGGTERDINRVRRQKTALIASQDDLGARQILLDRANNPNALAQVNRRLGGLQGDIADSGSLVTSVAIAARKGGIFNLSDKDVKAGASGLTPALSDLSESQSKALRSLFRNDPAAAIRFLARRGASPEDQKKITDLLAPTGGGTTIPNYLALGGTGTTFGLSATRTPATISDDTLDKLTLLGRTAIDNFEASGARGAINQPRVPQVTSRYLQKLSNVYGRQVALGGLEPEATLQINQIAQRALLDRPELTGTGRIAQEGTFAKQNLAAQFAIRNASTLASGKQGIIGLINEEKIRDPDITNAVRNAQGLGGLKALLAPGGLPGLSAEAEPKLRQAISDLTLQLEVLQKAELEQTSVVQASVDIQTEAYRRALSRKGADGEDKGAIDTASELLNGSIARNDDSAIIQQRRAALIAATIRRDVRGGRATEAAGDIRNLQTGLGLDLSQRQRANRATIGLANEGSTLVTGGSLEAALLSEAQISGQGGNARGSFSGGFQSRFRGLKQDLYDFSNVGAQVAASLEGSLGNAFGDFITGAMKGKDAFRQFAFSVANDSARAIGTKAVQQLLGMLIPAIAGAYGGATGVTPVPGSASGGAIGLAAGGIPAVVMKGEFIYGPSAARRIGPSKLAAINGGTLQRRADGGALVTGGSGYGDDVYTRLAAGSFVVKKAMTDRYGVGFLSSLASGGSASITGIEAPVTASGSLIRGYNEGGASASITAIPMTSGGGGNVSVKTNVTINDQRTSASSDVSGDAPLSDKRMGADLARQIEQVTLQVISNQRRGGGLLSNASLRG